MEHALEPGPANANIIDTTDFLRASATTTLLLKAGASFLQNSPLFNGLTSEECISLAKLAELREYRKGDPIFRYGDSARSVLMLVFGKVKISHSSRNGKEVILRMDGPGEVLTFPGIQSGMTHSYSALSLETSHVLGWEILQFEELQRRLPSIQRNAIQIMGQRLLAIEHSFLELATEAVAQRLARTLVRLAVCSDSNRLRIALTNEQLAAMIGATLFTVNRLLSEWVACGMVERRRCSVTILNQSALEAVADGAID